MSTDTLAGLSGGFESGQLRLEHTSLKDRAVVILREAIITGQIRPGSKLVESKVARLLGTSKAPARDALLALEQEGLVVSKKDARYVRDFSPSSISALYVVRRPLEKLAVELACANPDPDLRSLLLQRLEEMTEAIARGDDKAYRESDLETHRVIWQLADNPFLLQVLQSLVGPIFMFIAVNAANFHHWDEVLESHKEIIASILQGDSATAVKSMDDNLDKTFNRILQMAEEQQRLASQRSDGEPGTDTPRSS